LLFTSRYGVTPLKIGNFTTTSLTAGAEEAKYFDWENAFHKYENTTGNVRTNATMGRVRTTIVAVEKQKVLHIQIVYL
jgi:hypothetical protein